jgi:hypothetical protein
MVSIMIFTASVQNILDTTWYSSLKFTSMTTSQLVQLTQIYQYNNITAGTAHSNLPVHHSWYSSLKFTSMTSQLVQLTQIYQYDNITAGTAHSNLPV